MKAIVVGTAICIALAVLVLTPIATPVYAGRAPTSADANGDLSAAAAYCVAQGGEVETRAPYFTPTTIRKTGFVFPGTANFASSL